jgi:hypothetical protein
MWGKINYINDIIETTIKYRTRAARQLHDSRDAAGQRKRSI